MGIFFSKPLKMNASEFFQKLQERFQEISISCVSIKTEGDKVAAKMTSLLPNLSDLKKQMLADWAHQLERIGQLPDGSKINDLMSNVASRIKNLKEVNDGVGLDDNAMGDLKELEQAINKLSCGIKLELAKIQQIETDVNELAHGRQEPISQPAGRC
jgi:uncharacterized coiled-coil protein SlyX